MPRCSDPCYRAAEGHIYSGDASLVICPARLGEVGIAPRHAPMMTTQRPGEIRADEARRQAEEAVKGATGKEDLAHAQMQLVEAAARYQAAQKLKGKRREI